MPKRKDISSVMIIGAGPIVIGQACEFDYSGTQACKALKEEGYRVVLVNSNPATIMTDPEIADSTYVEPITFDNLEAIIKKEKPDALLPTMGGQTALNAAISLENSGLLKKEGVELIGAKKDAIEKAEDRKKFRTAMDKLQIESPRSVVAENVEEVRLALKKIGLPAIIRPAFTLGGAGGGIAYNEKEYFDIYGRPTQWNPLPGWACGLVTCTQPKVSSKAIDAVWQCLYRQSALRTRARCVYVGPIALTKWGL